MANEHNNEFQNGDAIAIPMNVNGEAVTIPIESNGSPANGYVNEGVSYSEINLSDGETKHKPGAEATNGRKISRTISRSSAQSGLAFKDVDVVINDKQILDRVSGMANVGEVLAIMGPSGAGKSTLLNVLGGRCPPTAGDVIFNGEPVTRKLRRKISYVLQDDVFYPNLTLRETLTFTALLRLPDKMPRVDKIQRVEDTVKILELTKCIDTKIGNAFIKGLSGGEKKRASIACELLTNPRIIILDEPTSGLDSAIAYSLMSSLARYAHDQNKTVVTTIHQPSSQVFYMFSNVLLIADGHMAYYGLADKIIDFFAGLGLYCQPHYNAADFILEQVKTTPDNLKKIVTGAEALREKIEWPNAIRRKSVTNKKEFVLQMDEKQTVIDVNGEVKSNSKNGYGAKPYDRKISTISNTDSMMEYYMPEEQKWPTGFLTQYSVLTKRCLYRNKEKFLSKYRIGQLLFVALIVSVIWWQTARTEETAKDRLGIIFFMLSFSVFLSTMEGVFCVYDSDGVFRRERASGIYRLSAYYMAVTTSEIPAIFIINGVFMTICYWTTGLMRGARNYFGCVLTTLLGTYIGQGVGFFMGVLMNDTMLSSTAAQCFMLASMLAGRSWREARKSLSGFFNTHLHAWIVWIKYLSYIMYPLHILTRVEFELGADFKCSPPSMTSFPEYCTPGGVSAISNMTGAGLNATTTPLPTQTDLHIPGLAIIQSWHMDVLPLFVEVIISLCTLVAFRLLAYIVLRFSGPGGFQVPLPSLPNLPSLRRKIRNDTYDVNEGQA